MNGAGDFLYRGAPKDIGTYMQRLLIIHNVSCVYAKYAMIDRDVFMQIGEFTNDFKGLLVSIDTCLKILSLGKQVVVNPIISICVDKLSQTEKLEDDEKMIMKKWRENYTNGDVYFSPNLSKRDTGLVLDI